MNKNLLVLLTFSFLLCRISAQPVASVNPASLNATINGCNDSVTLPLTIYNTGTSVLNYNLSVPDVSLDSVLARINQNFSTITNEIPGIYLFSEGDVGNFINDGGNDMYDNGNYLNTDLGAFLNYSDNVIFNTDSMGLGGKYFTRKNPGLFVFGADVNGLSYFEITGNNGADGGGLVDTSRLSTIKFGKNFTGFIKRVYNAGDPSINHLIIIENDTAVSQTYATNTDDDQHRILGITGVKRIYYLLYASTGGAYVDNLNTLDIFNKFLDVIFNEPQWLTFFPVSGTVAPGDSAIDSIKFKSEFLNSGIYNSTIFVVSDDPVNDTLMVPASLTVNGVPYITISDTCFVFDSQMVGGNYYDTLLITNTGCDTLFISNITKQTSFFSPDTINFYVLPNASQQVIVTFSPVTNISYFDTLTISNNDVTKIICLSGTGTPAPTVDIVPTSFNVTITNCNDSVDQTLTISNNGGADLNFSLFSEDAELGAIFHYAYICNSGTNNVSVVNTKTNAILTTIAVGSFPWRIAIRPDGKFAYVCNRNSSSISVINTATNTVTATIALGGNPAGIAITPDLSYAYVSDRTNNNVKKIDLSNNTVVLTISNANFSDPRDIAITPDGNRAFVCTNNSGVTVIDLMTDAVIANIPSGGSEQTHSIVISPDGQFAYVTEPDNNDVIVINTSTITIAATVTGLNHPQGLDITAAGDFVYVNDMWNSQVVKISTATNTIVNSLYDSPRFDTAWDLVISDDGQYAFVSDPFPNNANDDVMVIDLNSFTIINTISTGTNSRGMATLKVVYGEIINLSLSADTVIPSGSSVITVEFNALGLNSGTYTTNLWVSSNDPVNPFVSVPCTMTVLGAPEINFINTITYLGDPYLPIDSILVGGTNTDTVYFKNTGCDTLSISDINFSLNVYSLSDTSFNILPGDSAMLTVTFASMASMDYFDSLTVLNNQNTDTLIYLFDVGMPPPDISFSPLGFNVTLACDTSTSDTLKVYNSGTSDLYYSIVESSSNPISYDSTISANISVSDATNNLVFNGVPYNDSLYLNITINGDFDLAGESADLFIDGTLIGTINDQGLSYTNVSSNYTFGGSQVLTWLSDGQLTITFNNTASVGTGGFHRAQVIIPGLVWANENPMTDTVPPGDSSIVVVNFNSDGLNSGLYTGTLNINSNDPDEPTVIVPCTLTVDGLPEISYVNTIVYLGNPYLPIDSVLIGISDTDTFYLKNNGCDTLFITDINNTLNAYSINDTDAVILPGDSSMFAVTFTPPVQGDYNDSLVIMNNQNTDTVIYLFDVGLPPPIISFIPDTFNINLSCGDSLVDTLKIYNSGASDLTYSLTSTSIGTNGTITFNEAFVGGQTPTTQVTAWINFRAQLTPRPYNQLKVSGSNNPTGVTLTDAAAVTNIANAMNTMTPYSINIGGNTWTVSINGCNNGVLLIVNAPVCNCDGANPSYYVLRPEIGNTNWGGINTTTCGGPSQTMIVEFTYGTPFMQLSQNADTVVSGDSSIVEVTFNSSGMNAGTYTGIINISSNDPANPLDSIPVILNVTGTGEITLSKNCMYLDSIMEFTSKQDSLYIKNTGCDTLKIFNVTSQTAQFLFTLSGDTLLPGDSTSLIITFSPDSAGDFFDTLTVFTNVGDSLICLSGKGFEHPEMSVFPDSIIVTLACSDTIIDTVTIHNTGLNDLIFSTAMAGKSLVLDGSGDYLNRGVTNLPTGSVMTVSAWIYPQGYPDPSYNGIVSWGGRFCTGNSFLLSIQNNGRPSMATWCKDFVPGSGAAATLNQWNHIACVLNGNSVTLYMNGNAINGTLAAGLPNVQNNNFAIGSTDYPGRYFNGKIDEVRIYNTALSQAEILDLMNKQANVNEPGLVSYFNFDDGTATDLTANTNDLAKNGNASFNIPNAPVISSESSWLDYSLINDTIATMDSLKIPIEISSTGLIVGQYASSVIINSNDPLNSNDTVPVILNVVGAPAMVLSDSCVFFDTIMEFTNIFDTLMITNTGCDTLFITAQTSLNFFIDSLAIDSAGGYILPGDTDYVQVIFAPDSAGNFSGTLSLSTNDYDTVICLNGVAFPRPIISFAPDTIEVTAICADTLSDTLTIFNSGLTDLFFSTSETGMSANVDGVNDYMSSTLNIDQGGTVPLTLEAWVYPTSNSAGRHQVISIDNGGFDWSILRDGGTWYVFTGSGSTSTGFSVDLNQWQHLAAVFIPGTGVRFYKNGVLFSTATISFDASDNNINIGRNPQNFEFFAGRIDEARVWNVQRSQTDITSSMNKKLYGDETGLLGYWHFDNGTATDFSGNGNNGTLSNGAAISSPNAPVSEGWLTYSSASSDTVFSTDSLKIGFQFISTGLTVGQYLSNIIFSSNDPLNPVDTATIVLNVIGAPQMVLADSCVVFDTIMELTNIEDTFYITNTGCDTLFLSAQTSANFYIDSLTIDSIADYIVPGDTAYISVFFSPDSAGNFTGSLSLTTNDYDTVICLNGVAFPRPVITLDPDSFSITVTCVDTVTLPLGIINNGLSDLNWTVIPPSGLSDDFDPAIDGSAWSGTTGAVVNTTCGAVSGNSLMFNGNTTREAITKDLNTTSVPTIDFYLKISTGGACEDVDVGEEVMLEYSINGGGSWTNITTFNVDAYPNFTSLSINIPSAAKTSSTRFRWIQPNHSGSCCDHWAIDNVNINPIQFVTIANPLTDIAAPADSDTVYVTFNSSGLLVGQYTTSFTVNSNDPLNPSIQVPCTLNVIGAPILVLSDSCISFDTIMELTSVVDSMMITNIGCDTLFIDGIISTNFQVMDTSGIFGTSVSGYLLPGDTVPVFVNFLPDSTGNFSGTLTLNTNDYDTVICLNGVAFPRPRLEVSPDTISAIISVCLDSVIIPITVYNNGGSDLTWDIISTTTITDDFDPGINAPIWSLNNGLSNTDCGSLSGNALFFNDNGVRQAATIDLNTTGGGNIIFNLKISGGFPGTCEQADGGEDVFLQYSNNGGGLWTNIVTYNPGSYDNFTLLNVTIPPAAKTSGTRFRWTQPNHSGNCCDHWALEDISITIANPNVTPNPVADTTAAGDSTIVNVLLTDTNLSFGNYTFDLIVNSNDPLNGSDTVVVNLFIDSVPPIAPVVSDTSICFGQSTPDLIATGDSIRWYDDGALTNLVFSGDTFSTGESAVGTYTYYVTNTDTSTGCSSQADTVVLEINSPPSEPVATDTTVCSSDLIPDLVSTGTNVKWYSDAALTNLVFSGDTFITGQTVAGTYTYYVTDSLGGCTASPADTSVLVINDAAIADAGTPVDSICEGSLYNLSGTISGGASTILWTTSGDGTFDYDTALIALYTPGVTDISTGSVTLTISTNDPDGAGPCPSVTDDLVLIIMPEATVNAGVDSTICSNSTYTLAGSFGGGASGITWTTSGSGTFDNSNSITATYTLSAADISAGNVTLTISTNDPIGPCPSIADSLVLTINPAATVNAGNDAIICTGSTYTLAGTRGGGASSSLWTTSGDGTFDDATSLTPVYTPGATDLTNGNVTLTITTDDPAGPCTSVLDTMTITINATPAVPSSSDTTVCSDATIPPLTTSGTNIQWYSDAALTTLAGTGNSFNTLQTLPGSYEYWLTDSLSGCPASASDSATLTINEAAMVNAGVDSVICEGSNFTLSGTMGGSAASITWTTSGDGAFDNASLLTATYTPGTTDISIGNVTLTISTNDPDAAGPCASAIDSMTLTINPAATVSAGTDSTICEGSTFTLSGAMGGGTTSITWSTSGSGTFNNINLLSAIYTPSPADISAGSVFLIITSNDPVGPCTAVVDTMALTINPAATVNAGLDTTICSSQTITLAGAIGGSASTLNWTSSGTGTFDSSTSLTATYSPSAGDISAGTATLTITTDDPDAIGPCSAVSDSLIITINSSPAAPVADDTTVCSDATIPNLTTLGTNIQWYSDPTLTTLAGTGNSFNTSQTLPGSYEYWLTDSVQGCPASAADSANLTINEAATVNAGVDTAICEGNTYILSGLMAGSASSVVWTTSGDGSFDNSSSLTAIYTPGINDISTGNVTLTITTNDPDAAGPCSSIADNMVLTINPAATVNAGTDTTICQGSSFTLTGAIGGGSSSATWNSAGDGIFDNASLLAATYTPGTADISAGSVNLVLSSNDPAGPCPIVTDTMTLTINIAATVNAGADTAICVGNNLTLGGTRGGGATSSNWTTSGDGSFDDATSLNAVYTPGPIDNTNGAVTLTITSNDPDGVGPCSLVMDSMVLTINAAPIAPFASDTLICSGESTPNLNASGTIVQWYSDGALSNLVFTGTSFASGDSVAGTYNYYVTDSVPGCPASPVDTSTLVINALPAAPAVSDTVICDGSPVPDLIAIGDSIRWYDDGALTSLVANNDTFVTGISGTGVFTYYATQTDLVTGCEGTPDTVTLTINAIPAAPSATDETICEETPTPVLIAVGTNIQWYSDAGLTILEFSGDSFASGDTAAGVYIYYATQTTNNCESAASTVTLTIYGTPAAPLSSDTSVCEGSANPPLIASGTNIQWYGDSVLSVPIFGGDTFFASDAAAGSYIYYANQTINSCPGPGTAATLTIKPIPVAPVSSDTAICFGSAVPDLTATGTNLQWYSDAGLTNLVGTGSPFATGETAIGSYTYYVTDSLNDCGAGPSTAATLTIDTLPVAPGPTDASSCSGDSVPSLIATGSNIQWYSDAGLTSLVFTGDTFATGDIAAGTYTYYATSSTTGCGESSADSAILTINSLPSSPSTADAVNCFGNATGSLAASGTNIQWYSDVALTTFVFSGDSFAPGDSSVGTYTYYATQTDSATGCVSAADSATLTINALPSAPVSSDITVVYGNPVPDLTATGSNIQWYSDSSLSTLEASGNNFSTGDTAVGSYTYYVTQSDSVTGCESFATSATLTILPGAPTAAGASSCEGDSVPSLSATGTNIQWYSDSLLTTLVDSGNTFAPADSVAGSYSYFATQTINGFESPATSATLTINPRPAGPVTTGDPTVCESDIIPALIANGTNINWYSDSLLTSFIVNNDSLVTGQTTAGTYTYYATETLLGCEGTASAVNLTIKANPPAPLASDSSTCYGGAIPDLAASGTNVLWYGDSNLTIFEFAGSPFSTGDTAAGTYTYFAIDTLNGCASAYTEVNLLISSPASAPTSATTSVDPTCPGAATTLNVSGTLSTGTVWRWYSSSCGGALEGTGDSIVVSPLTTTNYFVRAEGGCDTTSCVNVTVNVTNTLSVAASGSTTDVDSICPGTTATLNVNGGSLGSGATWQWYSANCGGTAIGSGDSVSVTPSITTTYFVRAEGTCNTTVCDSVTVNIDIPTAPLTNNETVCEGQTVPDLTAAGTNVNWYSDSGLTTNVFAGNSFATGDSVAGVYSYYATETNAAGCEGPAATVVLTINAIPSAPAVSNEIGCEGAIVPDLVASGTFIQWYSDSALTALVASGDTFPTGETTVGVYNYFVTDSVIGCEGPSSTVTLTINSIPAAPSTVDGNGCSGDSVANVIASGTNIQWYSDSALTSLVSSGDTLAPGLLPVGSYTYFATQTVNGCQSPADSALLTVFASPSAPVSSDETICEGTPAPDLVAVGTNINWYDDSLLTNNVSTNDSFASGQSTAGIYVYYATETQNGCAGIATSVTLTINAIPAAPSTGDETACASGIIPDLAAAGTNINWYDDSLLTNNVGSGNNLATGQTAIGAYIYYATETVNGCVSGGGTATLTIVATPSTPVANDVSVCVGSTVPPLTSTTGNIIQWYDDATLINVVNTGSNFVTGQSAVGIYTYYVTDSLPGCVSQPDTVSLTINANPSAPVGSNVTACYGSPVPDLTVTGSNINWYSEPMLILWLDSGNSLASEKTQVGSYLYYATQTVNGCTSPASVIKLGIFANPDVTLNAYFANINSGQSVSLIAFNATSYTWSPSTWLNTTTNDTVISTPDSTIIYTVIGTNDMGCSDTESVTVNVKPVDVEELVKGSWGFEVYPNPNKGRFDLRITNEYEYTNYELQIYNILGEVVKKLTVDNPQLAIDIDLSKTGSGIYYVQMISEKGVMTKRVVVE